MKLISMSSFIEEQEKIIPATEHGPVKYWDRIYVQRTILYCRFLRQPLALGMFVPVDESGNILKGKPFSPASDEEWDRWENEEEQYKKAKEKVLFEGVKIKHRENYFILEDEDGTWIRVIKNNTSLKVEDLLKMSSIELTPSALKEIGL